MQIGTELINENALDWLVCVDGAHAPLARAGGRRRPITATRIRIRALNTSSPLIGIRIR